jgi:hypothetical protein
MSLSNDVFIMSLSNDVFIISLSNDVFNMSLANDVFIMSLSNEGYSRNVSCTLNKVSTFCLPVYHDEDNDPFWEITLVGRKAWRYQRSNQSPDKQRSTNHYTES